MKKLKHTYIQKDYIDVKLVSYEQFINHIGCSLDVL